VQERGENALPAGNPKKGTWGKKEFDENSGDKKREINVVSFLD